MDRNDNCGIAPEIPGLEPTMYMKQMELTKHGHTAQISMLLKRTAESVLAMWPRPSPTYDPYDNRMVSRRQGPATSLPQRVTSRLCGGRSVLLLAECRATGLKVCTSPVAMLFRN